MEWNEPEYVFRTGRRFTSAMGVIGIDPRMTVYAGYCGYDEDPLPLDKDLTAEERIELGLLMCRRWTEYLAQAESKANAQWKTKHL